MQRQVSSLKWYRESNVHCLYRNTPGLVGGGGGGSSFIMSRPEHRPVAYSGRRRMPGGMDCDPPPSAGVGEWDLKGGPVGMGGAGSEVDIEPGRAGGVVLRLPGYFDPSYTQDKDIAANILATVNPPSRQRKQSLGSELSRPATARSGGVAGDAVAAAAGAGSTR